jgi:hypothetical protein
MITGWWQRFNIAGAVLAIRFFDSHAEHDRIDAQTCNGCTLIVIDSDAELARAPRSAVGFGGSGRYLRLAAMV